MGTASPAWFKAIGVSTDGKIRVLNAAIASFTSPERAIEMLAAGEARYVDESTIEVIDPRWRKLAGMGNPRPIDRPATRHSPELPAVIPFLYPIRDNRQTFLPYPQRDMGTHGRPSRRPPEVIDDAIAALDVILDRAA